MLYRLMQPLAVLCALLFTLISFSTAKRVEVTYQLLNSPTTKPLATIDYDPSTLKSTLSSWTPPSLDSLKSSTSEHVSRPLLRILLPSGSASLTSLATFNNTLNQTLDLWLSPTGDGTVFSASISASAPPTLNELKEKARAERQAKRSPKSKKSMQQQQDAAGAKGNVKVNVIPPAKGPSPKWVGRKQPVVDAAGQEVPAEEEQEKSFFQKYWWIFLIGTIFVMASGGGDK